MTIRCLGAAYHLLVLGLSLEASLLPGGIVQLGVGVTDLLGVDEQLESLGETGLGTMP
jgi:hypothetical protein